jgi:hypothetical protein
MTNGNTVYNCFTRKQVKQYGIQRSRAHSITDSLAFKILTQIANKILANPSIIKIFPKDLRVNAMGGTLTLIHWQIILEI